MPIFIFLEFTTADDDDGGNAHIPFAAHYYQRRTYFEKLFMPNLMKLRIFDPISAYDTQKKWKRRLLSRHFLNFLFFFFLCNFFQPWPADFFPAAETLRATSKEEMKAAKVEWRRTLKHALHSPIFYRSARHRIICEIKGWGLKWLADEFANVMWTVTHAKSKKRERGLA